jgi:hypothetical protein
VALMYRVVLGVVSLLTSIMHIDYSHCRLSRRSTRISLTVTVTRDGRFIDYAAREEPCDSKSNTVVLRDSLRLLDSTSAN